MKQAYPWPNSARISRNSRNDNYIKTLPKQNADNIMETYISVLQSKMYENFAVQINGGIRIQTDYVPKCPSIHFFLFLAIAESKLRRTIYNIYMR